MRQSALTTYLDEAGISNRELSRMTGIPHSTLDRIIAYPGRGKGDQLVKICQYAGISWEAMGSILEGRDRDG